jgi:hypothetical protein
MPVDLQPTPQAAVLCAVLAAGSDDIDTAVRQLEPLLGPERERSEEYDFDYTAYYDREMGSGLVKQLVWFERLAPLDKLAEIKRGTIRLERELAIQRSGGAGEGDELRRTVNIDPGLVTEQGLNLATTKFSGHRSRSLRGDDAAVSTRRLHPLRMDLRGLSCGGGDGFSTESAGSRPRTRLIRLRPFLQILEHQPLRSGVDMVGADDSIAVVLFDHVG